eukprot:5633841-Prorocentrum_lima.AAC.1
MTDQAGANIQAERILVQGREDWFPIHLFCNAHRSARVMTRTLSQPSHHRHGQLQLCPQPWITHG